MANTIPLGVKVRDKVTGFEGVVTGRVEYISGCNQVVVTPKVKDDGTAQDGRWFDEQRVDITDDKAIVLDNGASPGCDIAAPVR